MKKHLFLVLLVVIPFLTTATTKNSQVSSDLTYNECLSFQDDAIATSGSGYIGQCKKATCQTGTWKTDYLYANDMVRCTNGNTNEYLEIVNSGCSGYTGTCTPSAQTIKYCSVVSFYDCSRKRDGSAYTMPTTTKKSTTTKKTTTTKAPTTTTTTKPNTVPATTTTTTTQRVQLDSNNYLKSLTVSEGIIDFNKEVLTYTILIDKEVTTITVDAVAESEKAKVTIENDGEFVKGKPITIIVTAEDSSTRIYAISIVYKQEEISKNNSLKNLVVENYNLKFKPTKTNYRLKVDKEVETLNIYAETDDQDATYTIVGNEKLANNSKIKIIVTAASGDEKTYTITVKKPSKLLLYIILLIILLILGVVGFKLIRKLMPARKDSKYSYE